MPTHTERLRAHWPAIAALGFFSVIQASITLQAIAAAGGHLVYAVDDSYIQMAIAKNFAGHGVWGATRYGFGGASTSLAWPLLLTASNLLFGVSDWTPWILNVLFAAGFIVAAHLALRKHVTSQPWLFAVLVVLIVGSSIAPLTIVGMEHNLQCLATLALVTVCVDFSVGKNTRRQALAIVILSAAAAMAVRYDDAAVVGVAVGVIAVARGWRPAAVVVACALVPPAAYALVAHAHGWPLLPTSVLLKHRFSDLPSFSVSGILAIALGGFFSLSGAKLLGSLLFLAIVVLVTFPDPRAATAIREGRLYLVIFVATTVLCVEFTPIVPPHRYEAYLVALGIFANACALPHWIAVRHPRGAARTAFAVAAVAAVLLHGIRLWQNDVLRVANLYRGEYEAAQFLAQYPPEHGVITGDIGAVSYFTDVPIIDANGLITLELVPSMRLTGAEPDALAALAKQRAVRVEVSGNELSAIGWERAGGLRVTGPASAGTMWFFAADKEMAQTLRLDLRAFAAGHQTEGAGAVEPTSTPGPGV